MAIQSKFTPMFHRRWFIVASAAAAIAPDLARAQSTVSDQLDWGRMSRADRDSHTTMVPLFLTAPKSWSALFPRRRICGHNDQNILMCRMAKARVTNGTCFRTEIPKRLV
jgi:hypothetical protein